MGSRPQRHQPLPKRPRLATSDSGNNQRGLSMTTVTPMIGICTFPIAFGAAAVAYVTSTSPIAVLIAILATLALGAITWVVIRGRPRWRQSVQLSNVFVLALLIASIGTMLFIGGLAALSLPAILLGVIVLGGAWFTMRQA